MENHLILKNTPLKVLILEDSFLDLELMTGHLTTAGYQLDVTHAEEETGFREALNGKKYDIILSDFKLPGFDAFGALEICLKICPEVPFICVSGSIGEELAIELMKKGAVDYVLKDRPERLPFAIKNALAEAKGKAVSIKIAIELQESETRFRQVAETAQEWIWEVDANGLYTYASPVIESLLGYTPDEVVGKKYFYDFFIPEKREEFKRAAFEVFAKRENFNDYENIYLDTKGQLMIALTNGSPVFDDGGNFKGYRGVTEDITERYRAEQALKESELEYRQLSENIDAIIWRLDLKNDKWLYVSPQAENISGYSPNEWKNFQWWVDIMHPEDQSWAPDFCITQTKMCNKHDFEYRLFHKNGKTVWIYDKVGVQVINNEPAYLFGVMFDITERKQAENALLEKMNELERFHKLTVGREITMVELKREVNNLLNKLGQDNKYKIVE